MRFFAFAPQDDFALRREARAAAAALAGELPDDAALAALTRERGADFATAVLYEAVRGHPVHRPFIEAVDSAVPPPASAGRAGTIVVVPGLVHEDHPELGADGALVIDVARRLGFDTYRIPTRGRGTVSGNAAIIASWLRDAPLADAWLVSLSKGGADLGWALAGAPESIPWAKLAGWINVGGSPHGSDLAAALLAHRGRRLGLRLTCLASRIPFRAAREIASGHPAWRRPLALPPGFRMINVVGMPLGWHVTPGLAARHRLLAARGPNDGVVLCRNAFVTPGLVYPVWGYDHYFRGPEVASLLHRLFAYLRRPHRGAATPTDSREDLCAQPAS